MRLCTGTNEGVPGSRTLAKGIGVGVVRDPVGIVLLKAFPSEK